MELFARSCVSGAPRGAVAAGMQVVIVPDLHPPSDAARAPCLAVLGSLAQTVAHFARWFAVQDRCAASERE